MGFGNLGSSESATDVSTVQRDITAADNAVVVSPTVGREGRLYQAPVYKVGKNGTLTISNGLSNDQVQDIVSAGLAGVGTSGTAQGVDAAINAALADRVSSQITDPPKQEAADNKALKFSTIGLVALAFGAIVFLGLRRKKKS